MQFNQLTKLRRKGKSPGGYLIPNNYLREIVKMERARTKRMKQTINGANDKVNENVYRFLEAVENLAKIYGFTVQNARLDVTEYKMGDTDGGSGEIRRDQVKVNFYRQLESGKPGSSSDTVSELN